MEFFGVLAISVVAIIFALGGFHGGMLLFGDTDLTYHFGKNFFNFDRIYLWNDYFRGGILDFDKFQAFYLKKIIFILDSVTNLYFFSYLWYFLPFLLYLASFYLLIREFGRIFGAKDRLWANSLLLALLSVFNGVLVIYYGQVLVLLSLGMLNLFLLFFTKNILFIKEFGRNHARYLVLSGLFLSQINIYLHTAFLLLYSGVFFLLLNVRFIRLYWRAFCTQLIVYFSFVVLLNLQWLFPVFAQSLVNRISISNLVTYDQQLGWEQAQSISKNIYAFDLLKLKSYHIFENYPAFFNLFYFIPLGVLFFFFSRFRERKKLGYFVILLLCFLITSLFLSFGARPPTDGIYQFLWDHIPFFSAFRTVFKFAFLFLYSVILLLVFVLAQWKHRMSYGIVCALLGLNIIFSGFYYRQPEAARNLQQYTVPDYYFSLQSARLSETMKKYGNAISSPQFNWQFQYNWAPEKIDGMNILPYFYGSGFYINGAQDTPDIQYIFNDFFDFNVRQGNIETVKHLLGMRNIKHIIFQNDLRVTNNESTPYVVKSNLEKMPNRSSVFTPEFQKEICAKVFSFGELSFCSVKNSLFTPVVSIKNNHIIDIRNAPYLNSFTEGSYFVPYNKHDDRGYSQVNLMEENPIIVNDLANLKISDMQDVRRFETKPFLDDQSSVTVYPSFKPLQVSNCFYQLQCSLFFFQNVEPGLYSLFFAAHTKSGEDSGRQEQTVRIFDNVPESFITQSVSRLKNGDGVLDYDRKNSEYTVEFQTGDRDSISLINLSGGNVIIRSITDASMLNGTFYLVREIPRNEKVEKLASTVDKTPVIEFKEINSTKVRVRVHGAKDAFPLVFSESFDANWKIYLSSTNNQSKVIDSSLENYTILENNEDDQASRDEVLEYIKNGWVSDLGQMNEKTQEHFVWKDDQEKLVSSERYSIDFISKNIRNSIQNNNLPDGNLWETWFRDSINENAGHFEDDGYANVWMVDPQKICSADNPQCIRNDDGTVDFELVLEFWPQRLLYLGLSISLLTFFGSILFLVYSWRAEKRCKNSRNL